MPTREVIEIDEALCNGCGDCVTACAEGAIQIVDGKARLVSDVYCDGLGACLGHCPEGAIQVIRREAAAFDTQAVEHHLKRLGQAPAPVSACPGSRAMTLPVFASAPQRSAPGAPSALGHWPVQLHLVPPTAPFFTGADVLLAADCTAFALGDFHSRLLAGRALAVACPKLDSHQEVYLEKLVAMIDQARIASLTVAVMEVPCCGGLVRLAHAAAARASREIPIKVVVVGVGGTVIAEHE